MPVRPHNGNEAVRKSESGLRFFSRGCSGCVEVLASDDEEDEELEKWLGDDWDLFGDAAGEGDETRSEQPG